MNVNGRLTLLTPEGIRDVIELSRGPYGSCRCLPSMSTGKWNS
jgi:hypothetical protein